MCVYIYNRQYSIVYGLSWSSIPCHANPKITGIDDHSEILPKLDSALRWRVRLLSSQDTDLSMGESSMLFFEPTNQPANMSNLSDATSGFPALLNFSHISPKEDVNIYIYIWWRSHLGMEDVPPMSRLVYPSRRSDLPSSVFCEDFPVSICSDRTRDVALENIRHEKTGCWRYIPVADDFADE